MKKSKLALLVLSASCALTACSSLKEVSFETIVEEASKVEPVDFDTLKSVHFSYNIKSSNPEECESFEGDLDEEHDPESAGLSSTGVGLFLVVLLSNLPNIIENFTDSENIPEDTKWYMGKDTYKLTFTETEDETNVKYTYKWNEQLLTTYMGMYLDANNNLVAECSYTF